jgi:ParB/RepB/Spo0J family partition protein
MFRRRTPSKKSFGTPVRTKGSDMASRVLRPGRTVVARDEAREEARAQIGQARFGQQLLLSVEEITANPRNPRRTFDEDGLNQLAQSMKTDGQLQPVVVRRVDDAWQLIAGERRWRAAKRAGIQSISAIERDASDAQAFRLALVENMHRKGLSHVEMVDALDELSDLVQSTGLRRTAAELRIDPGWLSKQLSMRRDPVIFPALEEGRLTFTQANELLSAPAVARRSLLDRVYREHPTFDGLREWVQLARAEFKRNQQRVSDVAAGVRVATEQEGNRFAPIRETLARLGDPQTRGERDTLGQILAMVRRLLAVGDDGTNVDEIAMYHLGNAVIETTAAKAANTPVLRRRQRLARAR